MDSRLYEAALVGDVVSLLRLLGEDGVNILDRTDVFVPESPLHIASLYGHLEFAKAILSRKPELARLLDSHQSSPLHLASAKGHVELVKELLKSDPGMCFARDKEGMTPLHAAALKGRVDIVKELVCAKKILTRVLTKNQRDPILHFSVNQDRLKIVEALIECAGDDEEFVKMKDDDDNTILHLSVAKRHISLTKSLLENATMRAEVNALNADGLTALDILLQTYGDEPSTEQKLERILESAGAKRTMPPSISRWMRTEDWLGKKKTRSALMVVAILIATVTFQLGVNPAGGVWQDDDKAKHHIAGVSIMAVKHGFAHGAISFFNTTGILSSLSVIMLLLLIRRGSLLKMVLLGLTAVAIVSTWMSYGIACFYTGGIRGIAGLIGGGLMAMFCSLCIAFFQLKLNAKTTTLGKEPPPPPPLPSSMDATYVDVEVHQSRSNTTN